MEATPGRRPDAFGWLFTRNGVPLVLDEQTQTLRVHPGQPPRATVFRDEARAMAAWMATDEEGQPVAEWWHLMEEPADG